MTLDEVDTPALVIDLDAFERNLRRLADRVAGSGVNMRPHAKTHKCPVIGLKQMELGAVGVCCQKVGEAEALVYGGVKDVLVTNEIVGRQKLRRLTALAHNARIGVCVDDRGQLAALDAAARDAGITLPVYVEVNMGGNRCGVEPGESPGKRNPEPRQQHRAARAAQARTTGATNSTPVTVDAAIWNLQRLYDEKSPQFDAAASAIVRSFVNMLDRWEKIDDRHLAIYTKSPFSFFSYMIPTVLIVSPTQWEKSGRSWAEFGKPPAGTGPFRITKVVPGQLVEMSRNKGYWDENHIPKLAKLVLIPMPEATTRLATLRSGQVDWIEVPPPDAIPSLKAAGAVHRGLLAYYVIGE